MTGTARRWPLFVIALPAAVAIWSGWVGLGGMCGFGLVQPFPGIVGWHLDTAITLPVGVEAYGAYALGAWLTPGTPQQARAFARRSAIGSLVLGMLGQVVYHLLAAAHRARAPWPVVVLVACLPVITLGFGAALAHLLRASVEPTGDAAGTPVSELPDTPEEDTRDKPEATTDAPSAPVPTGAEHAALIAMRATVAADNPLSGRQLETRFGLTRSQATRVRKLTLGEAHADDAAKALPSSPNGQPGNAREPDDCQAEDQAGEPVPA